MSTPRRIRVLVVDDSALARRAISDALTVDPSIEVIGTAEDAYRAREQILALQPDVVTLDLQMPLMDGLTFLRILMEHYPVPVIVLSSLTPAGSALALEALQAGAVDVIQKPEGRHGVQELSRRLVAQVHAAATAKRRSRRQAEVVVPSNVLPPNTRSQVLVIGASTGGVEALRYLLPRLPANTPPIVVVQHIPPHFSRVMAEHLDRLSPFVVREAVDGDELRSGLCLVAPGDYHVLLARGPNGFRVRLTQTPPVNHCRPSVDVLFRSAAEQVGQDSVAVLLTGMGSDGARGLSLLRSAGAATLVESEESCVVFGMPQAAIRLGAAQVVAPLEELPGAIIDALQARDVP
jgi:two-component system, chemotaxis family, protein-glutamate methylesterase/glutaminase